jgi:hypothetical protein
MMTRLSFAVPVVLAGFAALPALAQDVTVTDADGNGTYSLEELMVAYPTLTAEVYATIDTNADGAIDAEELAAAQEAGTLTAAAQ